MIILFMFMALNAQVSAASKCETIGLAGAAVYAYCPKSTKIKDVASHVKKLAEDHFNKKLNQVHVYIFNDKSKTPKDGNGLFRMSDKDVERHQIAIYSQNKNTGFFSFQCRKANAKQMSNCKDLLK